ncbi:MAG: hypothetical protein AAF849_15445 [Bacteroidota bacterium]
MSKVSVRKAAQLTGMSRETINTATNDGTISCSLNERGHKVIDIAELQRVYPIVRTMQEIEKSENVKSRQNLAVSSQSELEKELAMLRERAAHLNTQNEMLVSERRRERSQLESEIENLRETLERSQQQQKQTMLLLTDQRKQEEGRGQIQYEQDRKLDAMAEKMKELRLQNKRILKRYKAQQEKIDTMEQEKAQKREEGASGWKKWF